MYVYVYVCLLKQIYIHLYIDGTSTLLPLMAPLQACTTLPLLTPFPSLPQAGCNEPQVFTVFTKGGKFHRMVHGGFKALLQEYERLRKKEDKARKEAAIKAKMDAAYAKVGMERGFNV